MSTAAEMLEIEHVELTTKLSVHYRADTSLTPEQQVAFNQLLDDALNQAVFEAMKKIIPNICNLQRTGPYR